MLNLDQCDKACWGCIKGYGKKHTLKKGDKFDIRCEGIPKEHIPLPILESIDPSQRKIAQAVFDPVVWAAQTLDWHCLDPEGEVWKRKNPKEYYKWVEENPDKDILGYSRYHRPYQADMLRCSAKRKVFRIGRQAGKTESLVISMLFHMFNKPGVPDEEGFKIVVITPFQSQIEVIFTRVMQLIEGSPITKNSLKRNVKAPIYTIELHNGSYIRGFTAGTKSGGNADSVRGQTANMMVFDEADYLSSKDMDSAQSVITNFPDATVWMSSTPSGKREKFFQTCHSKLWKEFHYPSSVNPLWNDNQEAQFREDLTELGYVHEVDAEFGEQEQGVFQNTYVQAAKKNYKYGEIPYNNRWIYTVGVDWNDVKIGTTIAVLGFNPDEAKFYLVDRHIVSREGWNQTAACNKIVEVNRLWRPNAIYVDAGGPAGGGTQVEVLHAYGAEARMDRTKGPMHPDAKLPQVLKPYNFSSKVETHDIFTKMPVDKPAKPFLVESTVRRFESCDIFFPQDDDRLEAQLLGYIIDRITPTGTPVYKADNDSVGDHDLDALMLAIVAFVLERTPIGKPVYESHIRFSGMIGEARQLAEEGQLVMQRDRSHEQAKKRNRAKPEMNRTQTMVQQSLFPNQMPGNHLNAPETTVGLWAWGEKDNFMQGASDGQTPRVRTVGDIKRGYRRKTRPPRRKNI